MTTQRKWCNLGKHFVDRAKFTKNRTKKDGLSVYCAPCHNEYKRTRYNADTEKGKQERLNHKYRGLRQKYDITRGEYDALMIFQEYKCAICAEVFTDNSRRIHLDHDHTTGEIRGLLCGSCNAGLGFLKDSPELMYRAIDYLYQSERHYGDDLLPYASIEGIE